MTISRRTFLAATGAGLAAPAVLGTSAQAQSVTTLKMHHFLPGLSNVHRLLLAPWAKAVEESSGGKLKIDIFPGMQLGGTPPQLYDQARDGVADITWTLLGGTPGRFPSTEVFELPFIANRLGVVNARAAQEYSETYLREETKDVKLLAFWAHDHGLIHANKPIKTMADLKGLKLRSPTRHAAEALKALGASPVGMPVPQVPESLAQGVINGAVLPWEIVPTVKVHELVKYHTDIPGSPAFYTATFFLLMNKAKYESLPADLKKAIDDNAHMTFSTKAGKMWDDAGVQVLDMVKKRGNSISTISEDEKALWIKTCAPVTEAWIKSMKEKGLDGGKLVEAAKSLLAKHAKA